LGSSLPDEDGVREAERHDHLEDARSYALDAAGLYGGRVAAIDRRQGRRGRGHEASRVYDSGDHVWRVRLPGQAAYRLTGLSVRTGSTGKSEQDFSLSRLTATENDG